MFVEAMLVSGVGFTALCATSGMGYFDQLAEKTGLQKEGDLEKWQKNNKFEYSTMLDTEDMVEDLQTDLAELKGIFIKEEDEEDEEDEQSGEKNVKKLGAQIL